MPVAVVAIQVGQQGAGAVFLVPGAGASVAAFLALAECFGPDTTLYGLQPRGLDGSLPPHASVEEAAIEFVAAIRGTCPCGPYRIAGHSFGGWIAYEIALRLSALGEVVYPLVILDSEPPGFLAEKPPGLSAEQERLWALLRLIKLLEMNAGVDFRLGRAELELLDERQQMATLANAMKAAGMLPGASRIAVVENMFRTFAVNLTTYYVPAAPLRQDVILVLPEDEREYRDDEHRGPASREARWRENVPHLRATMAPGNHMTMLARPNVESIAQLLKSLWRPARHDAIAG